MLDATALLVLDAQVNMFADAPAVYDGGALLDRLRGLIGRAHAAPVPVIYLQNCGASGEPDEPGAPGWELHPAIAPQPGDLVIEKQSPDAFAGTRLQAELETRGIRRLVIAGVQTELCIEATCRRAVALGYAVTLVADGHSTFDSAGLSAAQVIAQSNAALGAFTTLQTASEVTFTAR